MRRKQWHHESSKDITQNTTQSVSSLISATSENRYFPTNLAGVIVFVHVTIGVAAVGFSLHDSFNVYAANDGGSTVHAFL